MERQTEQNTLKNALSQKQYSYDTLVQQKADQKTLKSLQTEIRKIESQLNYVASKKEQSQQMKFFKR
jgi:hypothetical protein